RLDHLLVIDVEVDPDLAVRVAGRAAVLPGGVHLSVSADAGVPRLVEDGPYRLQRAARSVRAARGQLDLECHVRRQPEPVWRAGHVGVMHEPGAVFWERHRGSGDAASTNDTRRPVLAERGVLNDPLLRIHGTDGTAAGIVFIPEVDRHVRGTITVSRFPS